MPGAKGRSGGRREGAGRKRKVRQTLRGEPAFVLRDGDQVAVLDGASATIATATIVAGALRLTDEQGRTLTIVVSE
jgi:hypothetical protein